MAGRGEDTSGLGGGEGGRVGCVEGGLALGQARLGRRKPVSVRTALDTREKQKKHR